MLNLKNSFKMYQQTKALGEKSINSEYIMIPDDRPDIHLLTKQFPLPVVSPEDVIEVPMVGGLKSYTPQVAKFDQKGAIIFSEVASGIVREFLESVQAERTVANRPRFNATIYHGTPDNYTQKWRIIDAVLFGFDTIEANIENRGQLTEYSGQIAYMYFPDVD